MAVHWTPQNSKAEKAELQSRSGATVINPPPTTERGKRRHAPKEVKKSGS